MLQLHLTNVKLGPADLLSKLIRPGDLFLILSQGRLHPDDLQALLLHFVQGL